MPPDLPEVRVSGLTNPVMQVFDEASGELVFEPPDHLEKRTLKPKAESVVIEHGHLTFERGTHRAVARRERVLGFGQPIATSQAAETAFEEGGIRRQVEAILGHRDDGDGTVKLLVRLAGGEELVVAHDQLAGQWRRVTDAH